MKLFSRIFNTGAKELEELKAKHAENMALKQEKYEAWEIRRKEFLAAIAKNEKSIQSFNLKYRGNLKG